jgi:hypothetical protein
VVGAVEVVVATCPCKCRPSLECHGDVGDGMVKDPSSCGGRAIPCCHRMGVVLFVDWRRSRPGQDVAEGVDEEWIIPSPRNPEHDGCRIVPRGGIEGGTVPDVGCIVAGFYRSSRDG